MAIETLIYENGKPTAVSLQADGSLWLAASEFRSLSGWELRPEGFCRSDRCVPLPTGREDEFTNAASGQVNLSAFAALRMQPVVSDDEHRIRVIGRSAEAGGPTVGSPAPDFALPDLDGVEHRLSDFRGRKVLLLSWASW